MTFATRMLLLALSLPAAVTFAQMPPITQPGPHHKRLESLAGDWNVAIRFRYGNGPERQASATCSAQWLLDGHYLKEDYKNDSGLAVLQILGFDNQKKKFFEVKFDNQETGVLRTEGTISEDGKVITNTGDRTDPMTGKVNRIRTVTTIADRDHFTVEWYLTMDDGTEQKTVTMLHTRK